MAAYNTTAWRKRRERFLRDHPDCVDCGEPADQVDHTPPRVLLVAIGVHDPDADQWLASRCGPCHSRVTRTVDTPLLRRWRQGGDPAELANEVMRAKAR